MADPGTPAAPGTKHLVDVAGLARDLIAALSDRDETMATAESLTGGLIGATVTSVAGASAIYRGGVISYATDTKTDLAGVPAATLAEHGAIAEQTAAAMARETAARCVADWGVAVTGVAGPAEQEGHPPGTVYAAVARSSGASGPACWVRHHQFAGDRGQVRTATVRAALQLFSGVLGA